MKKILSLLTIIALSTSATSGVISCSTQKSSSTGEDQKKANSIANQLNNKSISFSQNDLKTTASDYKNEIQTKLDSYVKQDDTAYSFEFATDKDKNKTLSTTEQDISIKIKVSSIVSNIITIQVKFSAISDQQKANNIALSLKDKPISFKQIALDTKASDYKNAIQTALNAIVSQTTPNYTFDFATDKDKNKTLSTTEQDISIKIKVGDAYSNLITIQVKFSDWSDEKKANDIATQLQGKTYSFGQNGLNSKASDYKNAIQTKLDGIVAQTIAYTFEFATDADKNKTLSTTGQDINIKIKVGDAYSNLITIKVKFDSISDQQKANNIANKLNNRQINFNQNDLKTKANDYKSEIQTKLNDIVDQTTAYTFSFANPSEGDKNLSTTYTGISIEINVSSYKSINIIINVKFSDISDQKKANDIANRLKDKLISFNQTNLNTKASDYKSDIQAKLNDIVDQAIAYTFEFANSNEADKTLSVVEQNISIKIKVSGTESNAIIIKVKFSAISDQQKANNIANQLNNKQISFKQINLNIKASDYINEIQAKLNDIVDQTIAYSFVFKDTAEGTKTLTEATSISLSIKIKVGGSESNVVIINVKFSDISDQKKANNISNQLNDKSINFKQVDLKTKASEYKSEIQTQLNVIVDQTIAYSFEFDGSGDATLSKTEQDIAIKIKVGGGTSNAFNVKVKFNDISDKQKATDASVAINNESISIAQNGLNSKVSEYKNTIQTELYKIVPQSEINYSFEFSDTSEGNKTLSKTEQDIAIKIKVGVAYSNSIIIKVKFSDWSDEKKANDIANQLNDSQISFSQNSLNRKASDYKSEIQAQLDVIVTQTIAYSFEFKDTTEGNKTLSKTEQDIAIKIKVSDSLSSVINIKVKLSDWSNEQKANDIADKVENHTYQFKQDSLKTQASDYTNEIKSQLETKAAPTIPGYTFVFASPTESSKNLSKTEQSIAIKIQFNGATSKIININVKFSDLSDQQKANDTARDLNDKSISFKQVDLKTRASDYTNEIQTELNKKVSQTTPNYTFEFNASGDTTLSKTEQNISIKIKVGSTVSNAINIKVKFSEWSDQKQVNDINDKIKVKKIYVPHGTDYKLTNPDTQKAIKKSLQEANSTLTASDLSRITLATNNALGYSQFRDIKTTITIGSKSMVITLKVWLFDNDYVRRDKIKEKLDAIAKLGAPTDINRNTDTSVAGNTDAIKKALQLRNPLLTDEELTHLTFTPKTSGESFTPGGDAITIVVTITVGSSTGTVELQVKMI